MLLDAAVLVLSAQLGTIIRLSFYSSFQEVLTEGGFAPWPQLVVYTLVILVAFTAMGLYQRHMREGMPGIILRVLVGMVLGSIGLIMIFYLFPQLYMGRGIFTLALGISLILICILRIIYYQMVDQSALKRRVLVLGTGERAASIERSLRRKSDYRGFEIIGYVQLIEGKESVDKSKTFRLDTSIVDFALKKDVDEIVVAMDERRRSFPIDDLLECKLQGIEILDLLNFFERETSKIKLDLLSPSWVIFSQGFRRGGLRTYIGRLFDLFASIIILLITWPFMLATTIAIVIECRSFQCPVLFRQTRVGLNGKEFEVLKFRSMVVEAEKDGKAQWATKNDSRVTRVGRFIRKTRIDELPQLFNVIRGDMSFVGPRPERPEFVKDLGMKLPYYDERHRVKPGITGWAQMNYPYGASDRDALEKLQFDLYYVKNNTLMLDLLILLQTVEVVIFGKGAR
jgi:sugar transferase (PEP-CTERM system associated)